MCVDHVVPAELAAFATHGRLELRFSDVIDEQPDMQCPRHEHIECLLLFVQLPVDEWRIGTQLLIHCNAGFSRSPACAVLVSEGVLPDLPQRSISKIYCVSEIGCSPIVRVVEIGDEFLGRRGELLDAVRWLYGLLLERDQASISSC